MLDKMKNLNIENSSGLELGLLGEYPDLISPIVVQMRQLFMLWGKLFFPFWEGYRVLRQSDFSSVRPAGLINTQHGHLSQIGINVIFCFVSFFIYIMNGKCLVALLIWSS